LLLCGELLAPHVVVADGVATELVIVKLSVCEAHGEDGLKGIGRQT
jgi:quinol-cytochrome oxidoreductase complex cytochrome b subunit